MGPIPVDRIISISSEEQTHKAENILNVSDSHQTWRCKSGEKQATVILQFLKPSIISSIDVGNDNSAFIEVFVGKSTTDEFQVLLVTSSLMTLHECKNGLNVNKVRFFDTSQLSPACKESWDRVKIVCTQPYIKSAKFGLSFITFHSKDVPKTEPIQPQSSQSQSIKLGSFTLRNEDNDPGDLSSAGRLFAKRHENKEIVRMPESPVNRLLALHKKNLEIGKHKNTDSKDNNSHTPLKKQKTSKASKDSISSKTDLNVKKNDLIQSPAIKTKVDKKKESVSSSTDSKTSRTKIKLTKNPLPITKPFNELLNNVIFAMSGYENPYRGNLRSKALEMGAKYKNNWDQSCTHLICAFTNTPKYNEAKRQGAYRIVKSNWIDKCHANRCRYPWRRFALDKLEQNKPESEDEIYEHVEPVPTTEDTDDEWNNVPTGPIPSTSTLQINNSTNQQNSIYDADTDVDSDSDIPYDLLADESIIPLPSIEDVFRNCSFYLSNSLKSSLKKECYRYIIALEGKLSSKDKSDYIVTADANNVKSKNCVSPQWIWDCYDEKKLLPLK